MSLTKEQVQRAYRGDGIRHPVIDVLESHGKQIAELSRIYGGLTDNQSRTRFLRSSFGFLADSIESADYAALTPLEIVAIWSRAYDIMGEPPANIGLGVIVPADYASRGNNPYWKGFPRLVIEEREVPHAILHDRDGLVHVHKRLEELEVSLDEIKSYALGIGDAQEMYEMARITFQEGREEFRAELDRLDTHQKEHLTPVLDSIIAGLGNGICYVRWRLQQYNT